MLDALLLLVITLFVAYFLLDLVVFRKSQRRQMLEARLINLLLFLGLAGALAISIWKMTPAAFLQIFLANVTDLCVLILATTGIVLIFKTSVTTNFAQGTMATVGAFAAAKAIIWLTAETGWPMTAKLVAAMAVATLTSFLIGLFVDVVIIRNSRYPNAIGKQMITMGLVLVLFGMMPLVFGLVPLTIEQFSYDVETIRLSESIILYVSDHNILSAAITAVMLALLFGALRFTKWGLGVRATASSETVAGMMGVNTRVITAMSWAIAGAFGGVAAFLYAPVGSAVTVAFMTPIQVNGFLASVLGGFSSFGGPIVGAILINLFASVSSFFNSIWTNVIVYVLVLLLVLAKPLGLFGKKTAKKV
jgi:branched-chain amino acid transport system permease protein